MLVVCDGGTTKADWKIRLSDGATYTVSTRGFNPTYASEEEILNILQTHLAPNLPAATEARVFYYGAGCGTEEKKATVSNALSRIFSKAKIEVDTDLLGAARATCGDKPGITCILGTGSNSVLYDGKQQIDNIANLGFVLGDEGSGFSIGKRLVQAYFYREMPAVLRSVMERFCPGGKAELLEKVYGGRAPAAYLASFVAAFEAEREHPFIQRLVGDSFREFLLRHACKYENHETLPLHFVGSVAWYFQDILRELLVELSLRQGTILHKPIENLLEYHLHRQ